LNQAAGTLVLTPLTAQTEWSGFLDVVVTATATNPLTSEIDTATVTIRTANSRDTAVGVNNPPVPENSPPVNPFPNNSRWTLHRHPSFVNDADDPRFTRPSTTSTNFDDYTTYDISIASRSGPHSTRIFNWNFYFSGGTAPSVQQMFGQSTHLHMDVSGFDETIDFPLDRTDGGGFRVENVQAPNGDTFIRVYNTGEAVADNSSTLMAIQDTGIVTLRTSQINEAPAITPHVGAQTNFALRAANDYSVRVAADGLFNFSGVPAPTIT